MPTRIAAGPREVELVEREVRGRHRRVDREAVAAQAGDGGGLRRVADDVEPLLAALRHRRREPERLARLRDLDALDAERLGAAQDRGAVVRIVQVLDRDAQAAEPRGDHLVDALAAPVEQQRAERGAGGLGVANEDVHRPAAYSLPVFPDRSGVGRGTRFCSRAFRECGKRGA